MAIALRTLVSGLVALALGAAAPAIAADPPTPATIGGEKVLTLVVSEAPGIRCNNNVQVGARLANKYRLPLIVLPKSLAGPDAVAPAVYYGEETVAVAGGKLNGMISFTRMNDLLTLEGHAEYADTGRLLDDSVEAVHDKLLQGIKASE